jgi:hypothetical protein
MRVTRTAGGPLPAFSAAYEGARFFLLDAPGVPVSGPVWAVWLYRALLFVAPAISGGILLDAASQLIGGYLGRPIEVESWRGHAVVIGFGTHGSAAAAWLGERFENVAILDHKPRGEGGWIEIGRRSAPFVCGELEDSGALRAVGVERASIIVVATRDQVANLGAIQAIRRLRSVCSAPEPCSLLVLVDDQETMRPLDELLRLEEDRSLKVHMLDRSGLAAEAARCTVAELAAAAHDQLATRPGVAPEVLIVGAGRYGQAIMSHIASEICTFQGTFVTVDPKFPERKRAILRALAGSTWTVEPLPHANDDVTEWVHELAPRKNLILAAFLCVDNDIANLHVAATLRQHRAVAPTTNKLSLNVILRTVRPLGKPQDHHAGRRLQENVLVFATDELVRRWLGHWWSEHEKTQKAEEE